MTIMQFHYLGFFVAFSHYYLPLLTFKPGKSLLLHCHYQVECIQ